MSDPELFDPKKLDDEHYLDALEELACRPGGLVSDDPRATLTMSGTNVIKPASGNASPTMPLMKRRLKITGDVGFATAIPKLFDIPKP